MTSQMVSETTGLWLCSMTYFQKNKYQGRHLVKEGSSGHKEWQQRHPNTQREFIDEKNHSVKFTNGGLDFSLFYFSFFTFILFYFLVFLFLEYRVRVRSQDAKNEVEGSRTNDIIQHGHHMLALCTIHDCLG